jgi:hypothetical protein
MAVVHTDSGLRRASSATAPGAHPLPEPDDQSHGRLWTRLAIAAYVALGAASVVWGLTGTTGPENVLAAEVAWDTSGAYPAFIITNRSDADWTDVRVVLDERWYQTTTRVPAGQTIAVTLPELRDSYTLPRPERMVSYEWVLPRPAPPQPLLPDGYRPARLRLVTDQGEIVEVEFAQ